MSGALNSPYERSVRSLADQIYQRLRLNIIGGQLLPGARLVEMEIASTMGTSQGPVREALQRLEREGLVQRQAHSATFVTDVLLDEMYELFSIRSVIEEFAIKRTVQVISDEQIAQELELLELMREAGQRGDMVTLTEHDLRFHRNLCLWSGSATLLRAWNPLYSQIQRFVVQTHKVYFHVVTDIADSHAPIISALKGGDPQQAAAIIHEHIMLIWSMMSANKNGANSEHMAR
jgi:DNA-binding GntR family transcriptional regulator